MLHLNTRENNMKNNTLVLQSEDGNFIGQLQVENFIVGNTFKVSGLISFHSTSSAKNTITHYREHIAQSILFTQLSDDNHEEIISNDKFVKVISLHDLRVIDGITSAQITFKDHDISAHNFSENHNGCTPLNLGRFHA